MKYYLLLFVSLSLFGTPKVCVVPDYIGYVTTMFPEDPLDAYGNLGVWGKIKYRLQEQGYTIEGSDLSEFSGESTDILQIMHSRSGAVEKIVLLNVPYYVGIPSLASYPEGSLFLYVFEPPSVEPYLHTDEYYSYFSKVFTWDDSRVNGDKFVKFYYPVMYRMKDTLVPFEERTLCTMIARNKRSTYKDEIYSERLKAIAFFEKRHSSDFDLYGYGWESLPLKTYKGSIEDKYAVLRAYKFSICFENTTNIPGYITEKIFDCFHCGVVPVYLGASNVDSYIPKECFIDMRDFDSYEELYEFMNQMDESEYNEYLSAIRSFLETDMAKRFSDEFFVQTFLEEVVGISHTE